MSKRKLLGMMLCVVMVGIMAGCIEEQPGKVEETQPNEIETFDFSGLLPEGERIELPGIHVEDWDEDETAITEPGEKAAVPEEMETENNPGKPQPIQTPETNGGNELPGISVDDWDEDKTKPEQTENMTPESSATETNPTQPEMLPEDTKPEEETSVPQESDETTDGFEGNNTPGVSGDPDWD